MHLLFFCPSSRATWFASPLALRVEELPLEFKQALGYLAQLLLEEDKIKARNAEILEGKRLHPMAVIRQARSMEYEAPSKINEVKKHTEVHSLPKGAGVILVDGS
jgi:hypothetical protein